MLSDSKFINRERQLIPKQLKHKRVRNFKEVALGYREKQAIAEAERCLQCPDPSCMKGCPVEVNIPGFIKLIKERNYTKSLELIRKKNSLPAITGRVCPVENQCENSCVLNKIGKSIAIGYLERFAAHYRSKKDSRKKISDFKENKVAIVGSGPAGLTAAAELAKLDYNVTVFESLHDFGGVLLYGIPEFRMPKKIVRDEVEYVKNLGVTFKANVLIGKTLTLEELFLQGYEAVFIGAGAGTPYFLNIPGENLNGIYSANEFLTRTNMMKAYCFPNYDTPIKRGKNVVVIGGGNVALDASRTALRLGADIVTLVYRRSMKELPARREEVRNAEEEGVRFQFLSCPIRFIGNEKGWLKEVECIRMKLGEVDASDRRKPIPIQDSEFNITADIAIVAIGQRPNPLISRLIRGLKTDKWGAVVVDKELKTDIERVWAGGDIVLGAATVINAMEMGKKAAESIHKHFIIMRYKNLINGLSTS